MTGASLASQRSPVWALRSAREPTAAHPGTATGDLASALPPRSVRIGTQHTSTCRVPAPTCLIHLHAPHPELPPWGALR